MTIISLRHDATMEADEVPAVMADMLPSDQVTWLLRQIDEAEARIAGLPGLMAQELLARRVPGILAGIRHAEHTSRRLRWAEPYAATLESTIAMLSGFALENANIASERWGRIGTIDRPAQTAQADVLYHLRRACGHLRALISAHAEQGDSNGD